MDTNQSDEKSSNISKPKGYAARLEIDYPEKLDRLTTLFRLFLIIPILIILALLTQSGETVTNTITINEAGDVMNTTRQTAGGLVGGIFMATMLMIVFQQRYPRWWFDFSRELTRFGTRVGAYGALLTDVYPSTEDEQSVHLEIDYPNVETDLNRWMPLVKWFLAIPHLIVLCILSIAAFFVVIIAWLAILINGQYPRSLFDFVVGVNRWWLRVDAYAFLLVTDVYPPFSLSAE